MLKLSIIVPIYNTSLYLDNCIKSVLNNKRTNFELILVNDGSTDKSEEICKKYMLLDKRVRYYYKENGGVSSARNLGLNLAAGEYITFMDSDDSYNNEGIDFIFNAIEKNSKADLYVFNYKVLDGKKSYIIKQNFTFNQSTKSDIVLNFLIKKDLKGSVCNKIFKNNIIKENNITFNEQINYGEDYRFVSDYLKYIFFSKSIDNCLFLYQRRKGSATFSANFKMIEDFIDNVSYKFEIHNFYEFDEKIKEKIISSSLSYLLKLICYVISANFCPKKERFLYLDDFIDQPIVSNLFNDINKNNLNKKERFVRSLILKRKFLLLKILYKPHRFITKVF